MLTGTHLLEDFLNANDSKVNLYIVPLISENAVAEQNIPPHKDAADGFVDYFALK